MKAARPAVQLCCAVVVGEGNPLVADPVDVGRAVAHLPAVVVADVPAADVVAPQDQNVRSSRHEALRVVDSDPPGCRRAVHRPDGMNPCRGVPSCRPMGGHDDVQRSQLLDRLQVGRPDVVMVVAPAGMGSPRSSTSGCSMTIGSALDVCSTGASNDPARLKERLTETITRMRSPDGSPFLVALDDVHTLTSRPALTVVKSLVAQIPPGSTLAIAGRTVPDLLLGMIRARSRGHRRRSSPSGVRRRRDRRPVSLDGTRGRRARRARRPRRSDRGVAGRTSPRDPRGARGRRSAPIPGRVRRRRHLLRRTAPTMSCSTGCRRRRPTSSWPPRRWSGCRDRCAMRHSDVQGRRCCSRNWRARRCW